MVYVYDEAWPLIILCAVNLGAAHGSWVGQMGLDVQPTLPQEEARTEGSTRARRDFDMVLVIFLGGGGAGGGVCEVFLQNGWPSETKRYTHGAKVLAEEGRRSPACKGFLDCCSEPGAQIKLTKHGYVVDSMVS